MIPRIDPELRKSLAQAADGILNNIAFTASVESLWAQWYGQLMDDSINVEKMIELVAKLRTLRAIPQVLENLKIAPQVAQQRGINVR